MIKLGLLLNIVSLGIQTLPHWCYSASISFAKNVINSRYDIFCMNFSANEYVSLSS